MRTGLWDRLYIAVNNRTYPCIAVHIFFYNLKRLASYLERYETLFLSLFGLKRTDEISKF